VFDNSTTVTAVLNALEQKSVARLMTQPTLISQNGRPAELLSGGEIPIQVSVGLGTNSIQFRAFGTKLDVVPIVHGQGEMTLEVRAEVSEIAPELSGDTGVPGFRVRRVNTSAPMRSGQTLVLAGVYSETDSAEVRGLPGMVNKPILGAFFRNSTNQTNETELVFLLTPRTAAPVDACALPAVMPGRHTTNPSAQELFGNGHVEVPKCGAECAESNPYIGQQRFQVQPPAPMAPGPLAPVPDESNSGVGANPQPRQFSPLSSMEPVQAPSIQPQSFGGGDDYFQNTAAPPGQASGGRFGYPKNSNEGISVVNGPTSAYTQYGYDR
jgi:pilus assembly protein CpaC